jgi:hypothetical protein
VTDGEPCPGCGLSADAILEINGVRRKQADEELKRRLETALLECAQSAAEASELRRTLQAVCHAIGCEHPHALAGHCRDGRLTP